MNISTNERITILQLPNREDCERQRWTVSYDTTYLCSCPTAEEAMLVAGAVSIALQAHSKAETQGHPKARKPSR